MPPPLVKIDDTTKCQLKLGIQELKYIIEDLCRVDVIPTAFLFKGKTLPVFKLKTMDGISW